MLFITLNSYSQTLKNDLQKANIIGKVKSIEESSFDGIIKLGKITKGKFKEKNESVYNDKGNQILEKIYYDNTDMIWTGLFIYNDKGKVIEKQNYKGDRDPLYHCKFVYDNNGNQIEEQVYNNDGSLRCKYINVYDDKGNNIESQFHQFEMIEFTEKNKYVYDDKGNQIEHQFYSRDGKPTIKKKFVYDKKGNLIESQFYGIKGILSSTTKYKYTYDSRGNWITRLESKFDGKLCEYSERKIAYFD